MENVDRCEWSIYLVTIIPVADYEAAPKTLNRGGLVPSTIRGRSEAEKKGMSRHQRTVESMVERVLPKKSRPGHLPGLDWRVRRPVGEGTESLALEAH